MSRGLDAASVDPVRRPTLADPHGVHPCSRYVELYWLGIIGPPTMKSEPIGRSRSTSGCPKYPAIRGRYKSLQTEGMKRVQEDPFFRGGPSALVGPFAECHDY